MFLLVWLACGVIAGAITQQRGRGELLGLIVGLLLGPIGLVVVLLTPVDAAEAERRQLADGQAIACVWCAELVRPGAIVCKHCGRDIPTAARTAPAAAPVEAWSLRRRVAVGGVLAVPIVLTIFGLLAS